MSFCITNSSLFNFLFINPLAAPVDTGITIKPFALADNVIEIDIVATVIYFSLVFQKLDTSFFF